jgi:hypothetical protein
MSWRSDARWRVACALGVSGGGESLRRIRRGILAMRLDSEFFPS